MFIGERTNSWHVTEYVVMTCTVVFQSDTNITVGKRWDGFPCVVTLNMFIYHFHHKVVVGNSILSFGTCWSKTEINIGVVFPFVFRQEITQ